MVQATFGGAVDPAQVLIKRRRWMLFQPVETLMAPSGHIHFHPRSSYYCDDFARLDILQQGLFIHEMTHVWQTQRRIKVQGRTLGKWYLPLMRHPLSPYDYALKPGWRLHQYGLEQQAEIVRHAFLLVNGEAVPGAPAFDAYRTILPFTMTRIAPE